MLGQDRDNHGWVFRPLAFVDGSCVGAAWDQGKGYMIVRGNCDYANDRKADDWHVYAAFAAAAFTRQMIEAMPLLRA
jgi:hypothetical protein